MCVCVCVPMLLRIAFGFDIHLLLQSMSPDSPFPSTEYAVQSAEFFSFSNSAVMSGAGCGGTGSDQRIFASEGEKEEENGHGIDR